MKPLLLVTLCVMLGLKALCQETLTFTVQFRAPLVADAGIDTLILKGAQVRLGSNVPASGGTGNYTFQWTPVTGLSDPTISNPIAAPESTTTYTLTVSDQFCISESSVTLRVDEITGIEPFSDIVGMKFYPNPNRGAFWITTEQALGGDVQIRVINSLGQDIIIRTVNGSEKLNEHIELGSSAKGIYLVMVSTRARRVIYKSVIH